MKQKDEPIVVNVAERRLVGRKAGHGVPTIVLEMGLGAAGSFYDEIARQLATFTRVVWYDRAGLGQSDPVPTPRTIQDLVFDLHALLHTADISGPYILAGHSLGGLTIRFYKKHYPEEVAALVLIDSAHEEQQQRQLAILPSSQANEPNALAQLRYAWEVSWCDPFSNEEHIDNLVNSELMRTCGTLGSTPLIVVSRGRSNRDPDNYPPGLVEQIEQIWYQMQCELAGLSSRSKHIIAEHSGHLINKDEPEALIKAFREIVMQVRQEMEI
ncbi:alpha/beta fold hydrolase [Dictyobacter aurantiacus]|uniref:Alpha/beta hydrolase n=1 Tax=Dictyobacter aurantiacus TaxID=1936993 RepID=A0A401ZRQ7_9CHLR|nr:alpha/beta hydrolase [Dictyobacter aurantiacus]GCE09551.1 alpha/beta hydrolase [Dictyobacter aurantiacus]